MLTHTDTRLRQNAFADEHAGMIKAIEDIFRGRHPLPAPGARGRAVSAGGKKSIARLPVSMLQQFEGRMHYELLNVVPLRDGLAVVKIQQTPLDNEGRRIEEATTSSLMAIAKSDDEWEMVGLPLPRHCLLQMDDTE